MIELYDASLRDGMQGPGMALSAAEKVRVARRLGALGIHTIEAGFPASNPKERELYGLLEAEPLDGAAVAAFGMTRRAGIPAEEDPALALLAGLWPSVVTIVGKTWGLHLDKVVRVSRDENLAMIAESVGLLAAAGKRVVYDAEHFYDAFRDDAGYALACMRVAADAGAAVVCLCDTNGSSLPQQVAAATASVAEGLGDRAVVGFHGHDDCGCGVANALAAVDAGARHVQGTMNGIGERTGNTNLTTVIANLQLKGGWDLLPADRLATLTETAHFVDEILNRAPDAQQPYVGKAAFAHKGGLHVAGVNADPATFEHVDPAAVGNARDLLVSELAGKGTLLARGDLDEPTAARVVERVKDLEHRGFQFEAADGSLDLLIRREQGAHEPLFRLESWRIIAEKREDGSVETEATIKIWADGRRYVSTAEGNGPVHALDRALRDAICEIHPHLADIRLVNYKVRILDEWKATGATTRVLLDATDGVDTWGAIGVHENVIEASWDALVDSLEAGMLPGRRPAERAARTA